MAGVYGSFYECFPELMEHVQVFTKEDKSDIRDITAIYMPNKGGRTVRKKFTSGNTALDNEDTDQLYISYMYDNTVHENDYVLYKDLLYRLTGTLPFDKAAGYRIYKIEKVTGPTFEDTEVLQVKEAQFD